MAPTTSTPHAPWTGKSKKWYIDKQRWTELEYSQRHEAIAHLLKLHVSSGSIPATYNAQKARKDPAFKNDMRNLVRSWDKLDFIDECYADKNEEERLEKRVDWITAYAAHVVNNSDSLKAQLKKVSSKQSNSPQPQSPAARKPSPTKQEFLAKDHTSQPRATSQAYSGRGSSMTIALAPTRHEYHPQQPPTSPSAQYVLPNQSITQVMATFAEQIQFYEVQLNSKVLGGVDEMVCVMLLLKKDGAFEEALLSWTLESIVDGLQKLKVPAFQNFNTSQHVLVWVGLGKDRIALRHDGNLMISLKRFAQSTQPAPPDPKHYPIRFEVALNDQPSHHRHQKSLPATDNAQASKRKRNEEAGVPIHTTDVDDQSDVVSSQLGQHSTPGSKRQRLTHTPTPQILPSIEDFSDASDEQRARYSKKSPVRADGPCEPSKTHAMTETRSNMDVSSESALQDDTRSQPSLKDYVNVQEAENPSSTALMQTEAHTLPSHRDPNAAQSSSQQSSQPDVFARSRTIHTSPLSPIPNSLPTQSSEALHQSVEVTQLPDDRPQHRKADQVESSLQSSPRLSLRTPVLALPTGLAGPSPDELTYEHINGGHEKQKLTAGPMGDSLGKSMKDNFLFLPLEQQESSVQNSHVRITSSDWKTTCKFNDFNVDDSSKHIDTTQMSKVNLSTAQRSTGDANNRDNVADGDADEASSLENVEACEHWEVDIFDRFRRFFKFDFEEVIGHPRAKINIPGVSRHAFFFQLYGSFVAFERSFETIGFVFGEQPGSGKSTETWLTDVLWHLTTRIWDEVEQDRQHHGEDGYEAKHLPLHHDSAQLCPSQNCYSVQCLCELDKSQYESFWPCRGHTVCVSEFNQLLDPTVMELYRMLHVKRSDEDQEPLLHEKPLGYTGEIQVWCLHGSALKSANKHVRDWAHFGHKTAYDQIKPSYEFRGPLTGYVNTNVPSWRSEAVGQNELLQLEPYGAEADMNGPFWDNNDMDVKLMMRWRYVYNNLAPGTVIMTTPRLLRDSHTKYLGVPCDEDRRLREYGWTTVRRWEGVGRSRKVQTDQVWAAIPVQDQWVAMPSSIKVDEAHLNWAKPTSSATAIMNALVHKFRHFQTGIYPAKAQFISGTAITKSIPDSVGEFLGFCQDQAYYFQGQNWNKSSHPCYCLSRTNLEEHRKDCRKVAAIHQRLADHFALKGSRSLDDEDCDDADEQSDLNELSGEERRLLSHTNAMATKILNKIMIRRTTQSKMFGIQLGQPIDLHMIQCTASEAQQELINRPATRRIERLERRLKLNTESGIAGEPEDDVVRKFMLTFKKLQVSTALPGIEAVGSAYEADLDTKCKEHPNMLLSWSPDRDVRNKRVRDCTDKELKDANRVRFNNDEIALKGIGCKFPNDVSPFMKKYVHQLVGRLPRNEEQYLAQDPNTSTGVKYIWFLRWAKRVWNSKNMKDRFSKGLFAHESTWVIEAFKAILMIVGSALDEPFFIHADVKYHVFTIDADSWGADRTSAIHWVDERHAEAERFKNRLLGDITVSKLPGIQRYWEQHGEAGFPPRFAGFTSVGAAGHSFLTFTEMHIIGLFSNPVTTNQVSYRANRVVSIQPCRVEISIVDNSFFDSITWARHSALKHVVELERKSMALIKAARTRQPT